VEVRRQARRLQSCAERQGAPGFDLLGHGAWGSARVKVCQIRIQPVCHKLTEHVMKLHDPRTMLLIRWNRRVRLGPQHIVSKAGQIAARADLEE
jgi:hypothetical protein